jgi:putative ABC transport system permease protein
MKTSLAWYNLIHNRVKTSVAVAGVTFAVVLMFMQLGFLEAVKVSATLFYEVLDFDLCLRSPDYLHLADARTFPRERLTQVQGIRGVRQVASLSVANNGWRNPRTGEVRSILCLGIPSGDRVFLDPMLHERTQRDLDRVDGLMIDVRTRPEYGPAEGGRFGERDHGRAIELSGRLVRIVGHYERGAGLTSGGAAIMTERGLQRVTPGLDSHQVSLGLIRLEPGIDPEVMRERLTTALPNDVVAVSRETVFREELRYWVDETNYGLIFQAGILVAVIVGMAIVYQVLASDVASLLHEYATLKAMGYGNRYLVGILLQQSLALALLGFIAGYCLARALYWITASGAKIPIRMTWENMVIVLVLTVVLCVLSGLAAVRKAFRADPADLF